jgi:hypothetical protein
MVRQQPAQDTVVPFDIAVEKFGMGPMRNWLVVTVTLAAPFTSARRECMRSFRESPLGIRGGPLRRYYASRFMALTSWPAPVII